MGTWKLTGLVFCTILLSSIPALPQSITGTILGTVYDSSGSVVPNAKVVATNAAQGWTRETTSDGLGNYIFNQLPPGPYKVNVTAPGFQSLAVAPFELLVDQRARVDASLQPGAVTEQVNVTAEATLLESDTNALGQVVNTRNIRSLPLNGRRFFDLALLSAGAAPQGTTFSSVVWGRVTGVSLAGTRDINVSFLVDGAETRDER